MAWFSLNVDERVLAWHFSSETPDFICCTTFRTEVLLEFVESVRDGPVVATVY